LSLIERDEKGVYIIQIEDTYISMQLTDGILAIFKNTHYTVDTSS